MEEYLKETEKWLLVTEKTCNEIICKLSSIKDKNKREEFIRDFKILKYKLIKIKKTLKNISTDDDYETLFKLLKDFDLARIMIIKKHKLFLGK